ncbi:MAG: ABC-type bacteriocin/lantibiotic exporter with double-glycine peptidase domain [Candidatus Azotimanducaceae bacterium]|jgi:ABC-type bacteriocin/lantibiotic exporter with double-glycine peptidase domain
MKLAYKALNNLDGYKCLFWIVIQQIIVASSTYFIIRLMESVNADDGTISYSYLILFVSSLIFVYIPVSLSHIYMDRYHLSSFRNYINLFARLNSNRPYLAHQRYKRIYETWVTNESYIVYKESANVLYELTSTFLNFSLSIFVICIMLDPQLLRWYGMACLVLLISVILFSNQIKKASKDVQLKRKNMSGLVLSVWDNATISNRYNFDLWSSEFSKKYEQSVASTTKYNYVRSLVSSITVIAAILIVGYGNTQYIFENVGSSVAISSLIVTLPRQIQVIQSIFMFFSQALEVQGISSRLKGLSNPLTIKNPDLFKHIEMPLISISIDSKERSFKHPFDALRYIKSMENGRITFRGENGSGKSTLLSYLATEMGKESFYLPTEHDLFFADSNIINGSDGLRMIYTIEKISSLKSFRFLILDEWDANLDKINTIDVSQKIDEVAKEVVVLEVRHGR